MSAIGVVKPPTGSEGSNQTRGIFSSSEGTSISVEGGSLPFNGQPLEVIPSNTASLVAPPPDGGFWAWISVVSGFFIILNTWGVFLSFGVFQTYYARELERSPSDISWIGSFELSLLFFTGGPAGVLTDAGFFRGAVNTGAVLVVFGTFMTSLSKTYWQVFLAQGVCVGLGNGLVFTPTMTVMSTYFSRKRELAMGLAACGSTVGGLIFPSMARTLLPNIGFGWTMRSIGFLQFGTLVVALALLRPRAMPRAKGPLVDWVTFNELDYTFYAAGCFLVYIGVFFPFFYLTPYARDILGLSYTKSLNLVLVLNGVGLVGRVLPSLLALRLGIYNVFAISVLATSLAQYCWSAVSSLEGLYIWTVFFSLAMGGIQSLSPAALAALKFDAQKHGSRMGMAFAVLSIGVLIGPPISGVLIKSNDGRYLRAQLFSASSLLAGFILLVVAREFKRRRDSQKFLA
ncbi:riboflavin transporter MCH5 [Fusarium sp. MPI-SDFR-AT-0072]|nr:riboflavin transporter MCH5 [Fusarium sp. MPI-SDFR-AT-0072]